MKAISQHLNDNNVSVLPKGLFMGIGNVEILCLGINQLNSIDETLFNETKS